MAKFDGDKFDLEQELRASRPRATRRFIDTLAARAADRRSGFRGARPAVVALVGIGSLAVAGGIGFAASSAIESAKISVKRVAPAQAKEILIRNAAADQYGETTKVVGPPKLTVKDAPGKVPSEDKPLQATQPKGSASIVLKARLRVVESGALTIRVTGSDGKAIILNGGSTTVDGDVGGGVKATLTYPVKVPRELNIWISILGSRGEGGERLTIELTFTDADNESAKLEVPAAAPKKIAPKADVPCEAKNYTGRILIGKDDEAALIRLLRRTGIAHVEVRVGAIGSTNVSITYAGRKVGGSLDQYKLRYAVTSAKTDPASRAAVAALPDAATYTVAGCTAPELLVNTALFAS